MERGSGVGVGAKTTENRQTVLVVFLVNELINGRAWNLRGDFGTWNGNRTPNTTTRIHRMVLTRERTDTRRHLKWKWIDFLRTSLDFCRLLRIKLSLTVYADRKVSWSLRRFFGGNNNLFRASLGRLHFLFFPPIVSSSLHRRRCLRRPLRLRRLPP